MSLTTPYREQFLIADGVTTIFPFDDHGDGFDAISKNYVKCEVYNADGSVIVPDFTVDLSAKTITITSLTTPDGEVLNAPQNGAIVRIYRDVPEAQNTTVQALQASTAKQIVQNFDNIVAMIQELQYANEHFTLRSTLPQRDLQIDLLRDIDDQKLVYWDKEKHKLVVTNYRQDEILLPADKEDILSQANKYSDAQNNVLEERINDNISSLESTINGKLSAVGAQIDANADAILKTREDFANSDQAIRDDMNAEDGRLQTQITAQAAAITTNKNDIDELGDDLAEIQAKIPESASGTNHLITKQQLLDEEMDIRKDLNSGLSELQTQVTAQAAKIETKQDKLTAGDNIIISDNVISATGAGGGAGFDIVVVQELPETGQKGIIYLLAKDGTAPDVYDEYVWITATQTFELIGSTKVDLSGYLSLSGGTMSGDLKMVGGKIRFGGNGQSPDDAFAPKIGWVSNSVMYIGDNTLYFDTAEHALHPSSTGIRTLGVSKFKWKNVYTKNINNGADLAVPAEGGTIARVEDITDINNNSVVTKDLTISTDEGTINIGVVAGTATIATNNGLDIVAQTKFDTAPTTDDNTTYANALDVSLMRKAQVATAIADALANIDALPDQTGNAGKVLTTDGSTASWQDPSGGTTITLKEYDE